MANALALRSHGNLSRAQSLDALQALARLKKSMKRMRDGQSDLATRGKEVMVAAAAAAASGYVWADPTKGPNWKPVFGIPFELLAVGGCLFAAYKGIGGSGMGDHLWDAAKGFAAVAGLKAGIEFKSKQKLTGLTLAAPAVSGEDFAGDE